MTRFIKSLTEIALDYDALVFDQWGVLHNGTLAYEGAIEIVERLSAQSKRLAVLSNSGKRVLKISIEFQQWDLDRIALRAS